MDINIANIVNPTLFYTFLSDRNYCKDPHEKIRLVPSGPSIIRVHIHEIVSFQYVSGGGELGMSINLSTTVSKFSSLSNSNNTSLLTLLTELYEFMKNNDLSEIHRTNTLKTNLAFAEFLGANISFFDIHKRDQIISFLDSKIKSIEEYTIRRWIENDRIRLQS